MAEPSPLPEAYDASKLIAWGADRLAAQGIEGGRLDTQLLLAHVLGVEREALLMDAQAVTPHQASHFLQLIELREQRIPLAKIVGIKHFWNHVFRVNGYTLDPRADSETLIELLLVLRPERDRPYRILDLGTGSGCLLLSALDEYRAATGLGIEKHPETLAIARENAQNLGFSERAEMRQGDWFAGIDEPFDIILCNPPYIPESVWPWLMPEVGTHEPPFALFAGEDGSTATGRCCRTWRRIWLPAASRSSRRAGARPTPSRSSASKAARPCDDPRRYRRRASRRRLRNSTDERKIRIFMRKRMPYNNNMRSMNPGGGQGGGGGGGNNRNRGNNQQRRPMRGGGGGHYDDGDQINPRQRKHVMNMHEKYTNQGRDALRSGDRVLAEYWFQHAEHYARVLNAINELFAPEPGQQGGGHDDGQDGDMNDASGTGGDDAPHDRPQGERYQRPRYQGGDRPAGDRQGGDRSTGERPPRPNQEGRYENRPQGDRPTGDRGEGQARPPRQQGEFRRDESPRPAAATPPSDQGSSLADILPAPDARTPDARMPDARTMESEAPMPRRPRLRQPGENGPSSAEGGPASDGPARDAGSVPSTSESE